MNNDESNFFEVDLSDGTRVRWVVDNDTLSDDAVAEMIRVLGWPDSIRV